MREDLGFPAVVVLKAKEDEYSQLHSIPQAEMYSVITRSLQRRCAHTAESSLAARSPSNARSASAGNDPRSSLFNPTSESHLHVLWQCVTPEKVATFCFWHCVWECNNQELGYQISEGQ